MADDQVSPFSSYMPPTPNPRQSKGQAPLVRWTHGLLRRLLMTADLLLVVAAGVLFCIPLFGHAPLFTAGQALVIASFDGLLCVAGLHYIGGYRLERAGGPIRGIIDLTFAFLVAIVLTALVVMPFAAIDHAAKWLLIWNGLLLGTLILDRQVFRLVLRQALRRGLLRRATAVIGAGPRLVQIAADLTQPEMSERYEVVGTFHAEREGPARLRDGRAVLGGPMALRQYGQSNPVDLIVIALPWSDSARILDLVAQVQWLSADVVVPFEDTGFQPRTATVVQVGGRAGLQLLHRPLRGSQGLIKIFEDYFVAGLGMLLISPILLLLALAIWIDSGGPVMFRQPRSGFNGQTFMIYKFRTMTIDPDDDGSVGTRGRDDPRITRVGKFLRRHSLDELPQLLNVLRGEMSVVGPRPYVPNMLVGADNFTEAVREYAARHRMKPGITGWAQCNGLRGGALRDLALARRSIEMDQYYISHWSLALDIRVMFKTLLIGMRGENVY